MKLLAGLGLLLATCAFAAENLHGQWYNTDLRGFEVVADGTCLRVWLEERTYDFRDTEKSLLVGSYRNIIRAVPVGPPSFRKDCYFPPPATNPIATQMRVWSIAGVPDGDDAWRIRTEPGLGGGDLQIFKTEEFETKLFRRGSRLIDSATNPDDPQALVFRPPAAPPPAAREILEDTVRRLNSGSCLEVMSAMGHDAQKVTQFCMVRERLAGFQGSYISLNVDQVVEFDRIYSGFPQPLNSNDRRRQRGVFFAFIGRYEKQQVAGNAVVFEEDGKWRVASLWF